MKNGTTHIYNLYLRIINSIAFYPTIMSVFFLVFCIIVMSIEYHKVVIDFKKHFSQFLVKDSENARLILGTIVASIISLMVFSFSMVMIVLNNVTTTLSPRVLPGLISNKFHQLVLGFYLGSIIFTLILIMNIESSESKFNVPSLGIFFSMMMAIFCLALFVYFIHSISQKIQVDNILDDIYKNTQREIKKVAIDNTEHQLPDTSDWIDFYADYTGYLKRINIHGLLDFCNKHQLKVEVKVPLGTFIGKHRSFMKINREINEGEAEKIMSFFILYTPERIADHYSFGFKQISEIAVKALSPGINDPGTATKAIDLLSDLFIRLMLINEKTLILNKNDEVCIVLNPLSFEELLFKILVPIREYSSKDTNVTLRLLSCLHNMLFIKKNSKKYHPIIHKFVHNIVICSKDNIGNSLDKKYINQELRSINQLLDEKTQIELLV